MTYIEALNRLIFKISDGSLTDLKGLTEEQASNYFALIEALRDMVDDEILVEENK